MSERIAIFLPSLTGGGAERMAVRLANEFSSRGFEIHLVLANNEGPYSSSVSDNIEVFDLNAIQLPGYRMMGSLPSLIQYLNDSTPDVLLSLMTHTNIVALLAKRFVKHNQRVVVSERNHLAEKVSGSDSLLTNFLPPLVRITYRDADHIIPISNGVAESLVTTCDLSTSNMTVIYNPAYSPEILRKSQKSTDHKWLVNDEYATILGVGRLTKQKNFAYLIKAFRRIRDQNERTRLIILGEGSQRNALSSLIGKYSLEEYVDLPGFVENPFKYMAGADVFVLSSLWEGFGNVIVESLACGTPVVSTDCPSGPAEILNNGEFGNLVPMNDHQVLAEEIIQSLNEETPAELLQTRAMDFSIGNVSNEYLPILLNTNDYT